VEQGRTKEVLGIARSLRKCLIWDFTLAEQEDRNSLRSNIRDDYYMCNFSTPRSLSGDAVIFVIIVQRHTVITNW
jgi:hypothetical protein